MKSGLSFIIFVLLPVFCMAQDLDNKVLMTIDGNEVQAGEFIRMYKKSLEPDARLDLSEYLKDYIVFKLKVADAINYGLDTTKAFKNELNGYRNQLAQTYLTDNQTKEKLIQRSFQRSLTEINAWHILVEVPAEASAKDTLKAWEKALDIRERIIKGESFEQVARGTSDDQSVKVNGGNLGYFTVFQMIMPFEDVAYSLKKGEISMPVRTPYGYHIIKTADKRPAKGKIKVSHIMKSAPPGAGEEEAKKAEEEIFNIYNQLQEGKSFGELAKKYSDHQESAAKGGELNWFGAGEIISDFSEAAFSIVDTGTYTKPVRTIYGWHIIKLLDRAQPGSFEQSRSYLESKINQSYLNSISKTSFVEKLKKEYKFKINQTNYDWFVKNTDSLIIKGLRRYNRTNMPGGNIYSFADQRFTTRNFADYIERRGSMIVTHDSSVFINRSLDTQVSNHITSYENSVLEKKYPEFRYLMKEFHDGMLLFEISSRKIWNKVTEDSSGLKNYYEDHKNSHLTTPEIEATIYSLKSSNENKKFVSIYKKHSGKSDFEVRLIKKFNINNDTLLNIENGLWHKGDDTDIDNIQWIKGSHYIQKDGVPTIIVIKKVIEPVPKSFNEVLGEMILGYQEYLESEWKEQLKVKYNVKIDNLVFDEVKIKLNNE